MLIAKPSRTLLSFLRYCGRLFPALALTQLSVASEWRDLLDEDLSQWETYLSFRHETGYNGDAPLDETGALVQPIGYNIDPTDVFSTVILDGELALRVSGEIYGCLYTKKSFENYRLRLKVKWGSLKWPPRQQKLLDTGILYHSVGEAGVDYWRAWMLSQEFQIMEGHMGDYWNIANSAVDIRAYLPEGSMNSVASATQAFIPIGSPPSLTGFCLRSENRESPMGEWTEIELICFEDKSLHIVNGEVVMILRNSRYMEDGEAVPLQRGRLQLQSEAGEAFFKDIRIQKISAVPDEYQALFE